jgi:O-antigen ligase
MAPPQAALLIVVTGIVGLFWLDRQGSRQSRALFVPFTWLLIAISRPVSSWLSLSAPTVEARADSYMEGSPLDRNILMALIALALVVLWRRRESALAIVRANGAIVALLVYCLISISWADFPVVSAKRWVRGVADVMMIMVILTDPRPVAAFQWVLTRIGFLLVPLSILFIRFYPELGRTYSPGGAPMWTGVCTDKNALGALCMIVGAVTLWRMMETWTTRENGRAGRLIALTSVFLMIVYLISIIDSKTAQMCFLFAIVAICLRGLFHRPWLVFGYTAGAVVACYLVLIAGIGTGALEAIGREESLTGRTYVWRNVLLVAADPEQRWGTRVSPWLGAGYESFWLGDRLRVLRGWGGNQAHNGYLEIYVNLGWFGVAFLTGVIVAGYRNMIAFLRTSPALGRVKVAFFVICLTYNFSEAAFKMMTPVWLMFLWATLATPVVQAAAARTEARTSRFVPRRLVPAVRVTATSVPRHGPGHHTELPVRRWSPTPRQ